MGGGGGVRARGETKNEDEVNDIHAGYRILLSRARPRLPSLFVFLFSLPSSRRHRLRPCVLSFLLTFFVRDLVRHDLPYFSQNDAYIFEREKSSSIRV